MSQVTACPHCFTKLRFKRLPSKAVNCPKCGEPIGLAYLQRAAEEADVTEVTPPEPLPPQPSEDAGTYSLGAPPPKPAPSQPTVDDIVPKRGRRQTSEDWEDLEEPEPEDEPNLFKESLSVLAGGAFFFFYGRMGGGITILHLVDIPHGFLYGLGVVSLLLGVMMLISSFESMLKAGYESDESDLKFFIKPVVFCIIIAMLWSGGYLSPPQGAPSEDADIQQNVAEVDERVTPAATPRKPKPRKTPAIDDAESEIPELPPVNMFIKVPADAFPLEVYRHLLIPSEGTPDSVKTIKSEGDEIELEIRDFVNFDNYQYLLATRGIKFDRINSHKKNYRVERLTMEFTAPTRAVARESDFELPFNDLILKHFHFLPLKERYDLNRAFPEEELQEMYGRDRHTSEMEGDLYIPERVGGPGPIIGAECIMGSWDGKECPYRFILHTKPFSAESEHPVFVAKEGYVLTGLRVCCDGPNGVVLAVRPAFSRYSDGVADPDDWYQGEPIGTMGNDGRRYPCGDMGRRHKPVIGLTCLTGDRCLNAIGLVWEPSVESSEN